MNSVLNKNKEARERLKQLETSRGLKPSGWMSNKAKVGEPMASATPTASEAIRAAASVAADLDATTSTIAKQRAAITALGKRIDGLMAELKALKSSSAPPAAVARAAETAARRTANDLAAVRREAAPAKPAGNLTAAEFRESQVKPGMTRAEFQKLSNTERNQFIREGGKLSA
jgi:hypothetical protein